MTQRAILFLAVSTEAQAKDDKDSLAEQERVLQAAAEQFGWRVVDTIRVPGASRNHWTWQEFCDAAAALKRPILDPQRMWAHWKRRDFDVLAAVTFSRLGREQSILAEVFGRTIQAGARIYAEQGGWINEQNHRPMAAFAGLSSSTEDDEIHRRHKFGTKARTNRGLPYSRVPAPYLQKRNERGKLICIEPDESRRRLLDDIARLVVVEKVGLRYLDEALEALGHPPQPIRTAESWLRNPVCWGHTVRGDKLLRKRSHWAWVFDERVPVPEGVTMLRHTHAALWQDEQAASLQAELLRRIRVHPRKRGPDSTHRLSGLVRCARCGRGMVHNMTRQQIATREAVYLSLYCASRKLGTPCGQSVRQASQCQPDLRRFIREVCAAADAAGLFQAPEKQADAALRADQLRAELAAVDRSIRALIQKQAHAPDALASFYDDELRTLARQMDALRAELDQAEAAQAGSASRVQAVSELKAGGEDWFWAQPEPVQNQLLHRLLDGLHFYMDNGRIIDVR